MKVQKPAFCTICGEPRRANEEWFLLTENRWTDRLKILGWYEPLVGQAGAYPACGAAHVQQMVVHWMAMGSLEYPFARLPSDSKNGRRRRASERPCIEEKEPDTQGSRLVGELAVHRESLSRILVENPQSLASILEAVISAISGDRRPVFTEPEEEQEPAYELIEV
jgi:hypothetical protein